MLDLGAPGRRGDVAGWLVARGTVGLCAMQAGVAGRALELSAEYARSREQFGRPIGSFQAADAGHRVAHTAVHVHGGTGIDASYVLHRYFTAAKRAEFSLGGATAQLLRLGGLLCR